MAVTGARPRSAAGEGMAARPRWQRVSWTLWHIISQIALLIIAFQLYKVVRRTFIHRAERVAFGHALDVLHLEQRLHLNIELTMQGWILDHHWLIMFFNSYYGLFMWLFYAACVALIIRSYAWYRRLRRVFFLSMLLALPWYAFYPLAPPRFMGQYGFPFVDTLHVYGPSFFLGKGAVKANEFAAMPSMHVGWTVIGAVMLARAIPWRRVGIAVGTAHATIMTVTVVVTANHYVLDIIGGLLIIALAFIIERLLPPELPAPWHAWRQGTTAPPAIA